MALNASGPISLGGATAGQSIAVELGGAGTSQISLNDATVRTLAGVASGAITMPTNFYGKANAFTATISTNQTNLNLATWATSNGWNGSSAASITIAAGVYIYATSTANAGLTTGNFPGGLTIINNGYILGMGGNGGVGTSNAVAGTNGGNALSLGVSCSITNNSYIAGGGGGGASVGLNYAGTGGGGGGAGGGTGGYYTGTPSSGGTGGNPGNSGANGGFGTTGVATNGSGGAGGGRILPGTGGSRGTYSPAVVAGGGGSGGGGGAWYLPYYGIGGNGNAGGSANNAGGTLLPTAGASSGGGGGWGANGGGFKNPNTSVVTSGGTGGKCVALNGYTVTWNATGTRYGTIS